MRERASAQLLLVLGLLLGGPGLLYGQTSNASISGVIRDRQGAPVSGVRITLTDSGTAASWATTTDGEGRYSLRALKAGDYGLRAEKPQFARLETHVSLSVAGPTTLDFAMVVGAKNDRVEVQANPALATTDTSTSAVIDSAEIHMLPNFGRNFVDFVKLDSSVRGGRENKDGGAFKEPDAGVGVSAVPRLSFGGQSELNTMILVDGVDNVQTFTGLPRATPSQEAAQEFRVIDSSYLAEYGRSLGGFVNIVTKSGANQPHGSLYYFGINNALDAVPILDQPGSYVLRHNQFGATLGGPLKKDRTFTFLSYEGQRHEESNNFAQFLTPSMVHAINGVLSQFPGMMPETLHQVRTANYDQGLAKLDEALSSNERLSVRYNLTSAQTDHFPGGGGRDSIMPSSARDVNVRDHALAVEDTAVLSPATVNEAQFQWARRTFGYAPITDEPAFEISNLLLLGKTYSDFDFYRETRIQGSDSLAHQSGAHAIKFGADFNRLIDDSTWDLFFPARFIFPSLSSLLSFGPASNGPADGPVVFWWPFLAGATSQPNYSTSWNSAVPSAWQNATRFHFPYNAYGFFAQDQWRATNRLSVDYGMRWDLETYPQRFQTMSDLTNFQPRIGLAYAPNLATVMRGGFGIFTDRLAGSVGQVFNVAEDISRGSLPGARTLFPGIAPVPGVFDQGTISPAQGLGAPAAAALNLLERGAVPQPSCLTATPPACSSDLSVSKAGAEQNPYAYHATLEISHQFPKDLVLSAGYLLVRAPNLLAISPNLNAPLSGKTEPDGTPIFSSALRYPALGDFFVSYNGGFSDYNGGTLEARKRMGPHLGFDAGYTYSKTISNVDSISNLGDFPETSLRLEKSLSRQDLRHRVVLSFMSTAPDRIRVLRGVQFDALVTVESGAPYTLYAGSDLNNDGNPLNDRPGVPAGSPGCPDGCALGRNTYIGPWFGDVDLRVGRTFKIRERTRLQLTADAFNAFNRTNIKDLNTVCGGGDILACPNAAPQSTAQGFDLPVLLFSPRDVFNAREIQLAAKLQF